MRAKEPIIAWAELQALLAALEVANTAGDYRQVRAVLQEAVTGFVPQCAINDVLWQKNASPVCSEQLFRAKKNLPPREAGEG
jgi:hypothetical protein